ncbi:hypothetical protein [Paenibacillus taiwanensis]|nr:hypothetical protein [Paenibacillus taiwanensis]
MKSSRRLVSESEWTSPGRSVINAEAIAHYSPVGFDLETLLQ